MPKHESNGLETYGRYRRQYESFIFGKRICALSWPAEAFYWRCHAIADDYGNFPADPFILIPKAGGLRRMEPDEVVGYIREMESNRLIMLYFANEDDCYGHFISFTKLQPPTGAPRGARLGRKRQYPESPWDNDIPLSDQPRYTTSAGGPVPASKNAHDNDKDNDKRIVIVEGQKAEDTTRGMPKKDFVLSIFSYWQQRLNHPMAKLSPERVRVLEARWKDSTLTEAMLAVDGCESSDFHMGRQPNNPVKYDDIELICRNRSNVERFMDKVRNRKKPVEDKKQRSEEARKRWSRE